MLIDERIEDLTEEGAKQILHRAIEELATRYSCEACAMRPVCGKNATMADCMWQTLVMLSVPRAEEDDDADRDDADQDDEPKEATILYDPKTMQIEE